MKKKTNKLLGWYFSRNAAPYWMVLVVDLLIVYISCIISFFCIYSHDEALRNAFLAMGTYALFLPCYIISFRFFHTYNGIIRHANANDFIRLTTSMTLGALFSFGLHRILLHIPSVYNVKGLTVFLAALIALIGCTLLRLIIKFIYDSMIFNNNQKRVFVYGVHHGGETLATSIITDKESPYVLAGFVADEKEMSHHMMMGVKVYLNDDNLINVMRMKHVNTIFVSPLHNESLRENPEFLNKMVKNGIKVMMQPSEQQWDGKSDFTANQLRSVDIEDLLPRERIEVDLKKIAELLNGQTVLVTGAAGSIGYEMARLIAKFEPQQLILVDNAETPMHTARVHMKKHYPNIPCETIVGSIANASKMESIFRQFRPQYVFHAAAYKHVPMMENNPSEAVQNNVYGTRVIADMAVRYGTKKFVMISTDKAVNPTNVMGCSKRICEIYCQALNNALEEERKNPTTADLTQLPKWKKQLRQADGSVGITQFITTRFGNVLGSNGSVIPIFKKQIEQGGPVTVTHPDIIRFFMLIPEACRLVLEAGTIGHGGEIFVFDMGKPVRIAELAQRMIELSGARGVKIEYTGLRDGEKLYEEVLSDQELTRPTPHPKIMVSAVREYPYELALKNEEELFAISYTYDDMAVVRKMKEIVPEYLSRHSKYEALDLEPRK
ncbi:MAG: polysaccharide biosynthesis protein [Bacteroidales bacterium]|nr:polysaccharide biosynthesis protein [Candidatus Physcousia equi]